MPDSRTVTWPPSGSYYIAVICPYCGNSHRGEHCPRVKAIEYHDDGTVKRIEFFEAATSEPTVITWTTNSANFNGDSDQEFLAAAGRISY